MIGRTPYALFTWLIQVVVLVTSWCHSLQAYTPLGADKTSADDLALSPADWSSAAGLQKVHDQHLRQQHVPVSCSPGPGQPPKVTSGGDTTYISTEPASQVRSV